MPKTICQIRWGMQKREKGRDGLRSQKGAKVKGKKKEEDRGEVMES